jgi:pimeloyl-ACP methyl ester carboxylesterase
MAFFLLSGCCEVKMYRKNRLYSFMGAILSLLLISYTAHANDEKQVCFDPSVVSNKIILDQTGRSFDYKYRIVRKAEQGFPTVIYLPGGPGQTSIEGILTQPKTVPPKFGLILTDPRGIGCNFNENLKKNDFQTPLLAGDILSILKDMSLSPEQTILYGASYGTVLATTTAELNNRLGNKPFKMLVLEGVLGKAFVGQEYLNQYAISWEKYVSRKGGNDFRKKISSAVIVNNLDKSMFASFLNGYLLLGSWGNMGHVLDMPLDLLQNDFSKFKNDYYTPSPSHDSMNAEGQMYLNLWSQIWCREISNPGDGQELLFDNGKLIVSQTVNGKNDKSCDGAKPDRLYDSKTISLREKIVYLQGEDDPATSATQAYYHFVNQKKSQERVFVLFKQLGHAPSAVIQMLMAGKMDSIWYEGFSEKSFDILNGTSFQFKIERKLKGE